jgi:hypothetical protein
MIVPLISHLVRFGLSTEKGYAQQGGFLYPESEITWLDAVK